MLLENTKSSSMIHHYLGQIRISFSVWNQCHQRFPGDKRVPLALTAKGESFELKQNQAKTRR